MAPGQTSDAAQHRCQSNAYAYASGPLRTFSMLQISAEHPPKRGHSSIAQHFGETH